MELRPEELPQLPELLEPEELRLQPLPLFTRTSVPPRRKLAKVTTLFWFPTL